MRTKSNFSQQIREFGIEFNTVVSIVMDKYGDICKEKIQGMDIRRVDENNITKKEINSLYAKVKTVE